jgi:malonate decarboxylase epsilon subunit
MLAALPDSPAVTAVIDESLTVCTELGMPVELDSAENLRDTAVTQVCLVITGVACARALVVEGDLATQFVFGHSAGAFTAAVTAGVLTLREALVAVQLRGNSMRAACSGRDWGMAAVAGLPTRTVAQLVDRITTTEQPLWIANINSATQTVLSGTASALNAARDAVGDAGATDFRALDVSVASHGPVQGTTAHTMTSQMSTILRRRPGMRYVTNIGGRSVSTAEAVLDDLANAVVHPVRWYDGVRLMAELGVTCTVEALPGHTLTRLVGSVRQPPVALAVSDHGLQGAVARARRVLIPGRRIQSRWAQQ